MVRDLHKSWMRIISAEIMNVLRISCLPFTHGSCKPESSFVHLSENGSVIVVLSHEEFTLQRLEEDLRLYYIYFILTEATLAENLLR